MHSHKKKGKRAKRKEDVKLPLYADGMIIYVENMRWMESNDVTQSSKGK